jgi:hypothetical protein
MLSLRHRRLGMPPVGDAPTYPVGQPRVSTVADTALNYFCSNLDTPPNKLERRRTSPSGDCDQPHLWYRRVLYFSRAVSLVNFRVAVVLDESGSSRSTPTMAALSSRVMTHSVIASTVAKRSVWPFRQPSPKNSPVPCKATTASFPNSDVTQNLDAALLNAGRADGSAL